MTLSDTIKAGAKEALLNKDEVRLTTLRSIQAAATNEAIAKKVPALDDESVLAIIRRLVKQHRDSIEQFEKGNRADLASSERAELVVLEEFLPAMLSRAEIKKRAVAKQKELNVTDKAQAGALTGALMRELKGKADGADVKAVVDELLA